MATIPVVWIPAFVFGNVFALFWLFKMLLTKSSALSGALSRLRNERPVAQQKNTATKMRHSELQQIAAQLKAKIRDHEEALPVSLSSEQATATDSFTEALPNPELVRRYVSRSTSVQVSPVSLEWRNVGCSYSQGDCNKVVLQGVYGTAKPQEMMALMGPSGAGKSTLLDILTMRKNVGQVEGEVLVNGQPRDASFLSNSSYVPQEDNFVPTMTVLETLMFYARLVLPAAMSLNEKRQRVLEVLNMVGLSEAKHTMVGGLLPGGIHFRGLSGGERRRLSIATGVVSAPSVIFLDEPTSGLDGFAALNVMQYMKTLSESKHHTVIACVHQPRIGIWNMFDKVLPQETDSTANRCAQALILSKGRMLYSGEVNEVIPWFTRQLGYDYDPSVNGVVSDWVIDLVSVGFSKPKAFYGDSMRSLAEVQMAADKFLERYKKDQICHESWNTLELEPKQPTASPAKWVVGVEQNSQTKEQSNTTNSGHYRSTWLSQFFNLYWRSFLSITRNPADVAGRMLTFTYVGLFIGLIFYSLADGSESVVTRLNLLYNCSAFYMFIPYISMSLFTSGRQFYSADIQSKLYRPSAYYCSSVMANLPFSIANATVFALVVYGLAGLREDTNAILQNLIILVLESLIAIQVLCLAATVTPNQDMAFMLAIAFTAVNMLLSNFFIPFDMIELPWVSSMKWLSAMGYTWNALTKIEFQHRDFSCAGAASLFSDVEGVIKEGLPNLNPNHASIFTGIVSDPEPDCVVNTDQVLSFFDISAGFQTTVMILVGYLCILHVLTFTGLRLVSFKDKK